MYNKIPDIMKSLLSLLLVIALVAGCKNTTNKTEAIKPVKYEQLAYSDQNYSYAFSGVVKAEYETNLSFKVGGTLNLVNVRFGEKVKKGQLIASIDPTDYKIMEDQAVAQKSGAESQLINARSHFERMEKLYENNSVSLSEYEQAKAGLSSAESQYDAAEKQLEAAISQVSYTKLYAPLDGVISSLMVEANETVSAGKSIAVISSEGSPQVEVEVPESFISKLEYRQKANIKFPSVSGHNFNGDVVEISFAPGKSTTYPVTLSIIDPVSEIRPGMSAEVTFSFASLDQESFLVAPLKAIASGVDGNYVFKLVADKEEGIYTAKKVGVELGAITKDGYIIKEGVKEGDLVAIAGLRSLYDGRKVKLLEE
jgi:RND family efflux transporter MFP subunit